MNRSIDKMDYETAVKYLTSVLGECSASAKFAIQKIECLLRIPNINEALNYSESLLRMPEF